MENPPVDELMNDIEQRAEVTLALLRVLETAEMMSVTRGAILNWIEEGLRGERARFQALRGDHLPAPVS